MYQRADPRKLVRALVGQAPQSQTAVGLAALPKQGCTVTISRDCCANGEEIARRLAMRLCVRCYDRELLNGMLNEAHGDKMLLEQLDERVQGMLDDVIRDLFSNERFGADRYRSSLVRLVLRISSTGGVIVGRGANLILAQKRVYHVRIVGSPLICARRMSEREKIPVNVALEKVQTINSERADFIRQHFKQDINTPSNYHLMLNTDSVRVDDAVRMILFGMETSGFSVPNAASASY